MNNRNTLLEQARLSRHRRGPVSAPFHREHAVAEIGCGESFIRRRHSLVPHPSRRGHPPQCGVLQPALGGVTIDFETSLGFFATDGGAQPAIIARRDCQV